MPAVTKRVPLLLTEKFLPGLGTEHEVGLGGVGYSVTTATIAVMEGSILTAANLLASPPNTSATANACGPLVHSLGAAPSAAFIYTVGPSIANMDQAINFQYCTADNSAVYFWARLWTGTTPVGVPVRMIAMR